jgi:DNA-3-methyladenine glycosylase II
MRLPGIGPWSAGLVLLRGFRRLEVFPENDSGAQRNLRTLFQVRSKVALRRIVERFGDYRGYLYFCALASHLAQSGLIQSDPRSGKRGRVGCVG